MARIEHYRRTSIIHFTFQILFLAIFYMLGGTSLPTSGSLTHIVVLLIMTIAPSIIWALFFYLSDRKEPEPTRYLVTSFLSGLSGGFVILTLRSALFDIESWVHLSWWSLAFGSVFVVGTLFAGLVYAILRYGYYYMREFDEPEDGMVYGAFIGVGIGLVESWQYLMHHTAFTLFASAYTASTNALFYSSVGSLIGYFIGKEKFAKGKGSYYSLEAIGVGMVFTGIWHAVREVIFVSGVKHGLLLSFGVTFVISALTVFIAHRKIQQLEDTGVHEDLHIPFRFEIPVFITLVGLMLTGFLIRGVCTKDITYRDPILGLSFSYPYWYRELPVSPEQFVTSRVSINARTTIFAAGGDRDGKFIISVQSQAGKLDVHQLDISSLLGAPDQRTFMSTGTISIGGHEGVRIIYEFLGKNVRSEAGFPEIYNVICDVVPSNNGTLIFNLKSTANHFDQHKTEYDGILQSFRWEKQ